MRAPWIVEETSHFPIAAFNDLQDVEIALMMASGGIAHNVIDFRENARAVSFERERMHAP
jgi:hypothetical protein